MKFLDQAKINLKAGNGGSGSASFRREKFVEFGGPMVVMVVMVDRSYLKQREI